MEISKEKLTPGGAEDGKEKEPDIDFVAVFKERLANAQSVPEREQELVAFDYRETELKSIKKIITAGIFLWENPNGDEYNLWILPENDPKVRTYHNQIDDNLSRSLGNERDKMILGPFSAHVIVGFGKRDSKVKTVLAVHESFAEALESEKKKAADEAFFENWMNFMKSYGIDVIVGRFKDTLPVAKQSTRENPREILNMDIIERMMEGREIMKVAREKYLTNYGAMRLSLGFYSAKKAGLNYDLREEADKLSKEALGHPYERS